MTKKVKDKKKAGFKLISDERLIELYRAMLDFRSVESELAGRERRGKVHTGKEAIAAGVLLHLGKEDRVVLAAGERAHRYLKGEKLDHLFRNADLHLSTGLIPMDETSSGAEQVMLASGVALALKSAKKKHAAVIVFVEGNETAGKEWEAALKFAVRQKLGLIIVCHGAAALKQSKLRKRQRISLDEPGARSAVKGLPPALQVDASDCVAVYRVTQEALTHAREGSRPTVIRAFGSEELSGEKGVHWGDSIARMEEYLQSKKLFSRKLQKNILSEFKKKMKVVQAQ